MDEIKTCEQYVVQKVVELEEACKAYEEDLKCKEREIERIISLLKDKLKLTITIHQNTGDIFYCMSIPSYNSDKWTEIQNDLIDLGLVGCIEYKD